MPDFPSKESQISGYLVELHLFILYLPRFMGDGGKELTDELIALSVYI
jgi:hypothetical protein